MPYHLRAMKRSAWLILFLIALSGCSSSLPPAAVPVAPVHVVIVGTTDVHGWFDGHTEQVKNTTTSVRYGGFDVLASYVEALRSANGNRVILIDSGDLFQGTLESNLFEGEPVIRAYNALGYTASAVGNHEFDYGPVGPDSVVRGPGQDPLGALERNAGLARFPFLSANMVEKATGKTPAWARPWIMVDAAGAKIAVVGLSTPDTPNTTVYSNVSALAFTDPVEAVIRSSREARAAGADAVVVAGHMGGRCTDLQDVHDVASCDQKQEAMQFLAALPAGTIDAYFGGHTHAQMREFVNGVPAVQALPFGTAFSTIDLWVDPAAHHAVASRSEMRPHTMVCTDVYRGTVSCDPRQAPATIELVPRVFEGQTIHADARVTAIIQPYLEQVAQKKNELLGIRTAARFTRAYETESTLGDVLADALRDVTGADVALVNSGGIRAPLPAGDLKFADIFDVSPFDNFVAVATMTGADIREALRITATGERGILQVSGIRYTIDRTKDAGKPIPQRDRVTAVTLANGAPLDPNALYRVAMPDFLATGGEGLAPVMQRIPKERIAFDQNRTLRDAFVEGMRKRPMPLEPKLDARVSVLGDVPGGSE
jgi:5'-nucleotidase